MSNLSRHFKAIKKLILREKIFYHLGKLNIKQLKRIEKYLKRYYKV